MSIKKIANSMFLLLVSATPLTLIAQAEATASVQTLSHSFQRLPGCGCPQPPGWEKTPNFIYHPTVVCPDFLASATTVKRTIYCPDFRRTVPDSAHQSSIQLAYDPVERDAAKEARDAAARGHSPREVLDAAGRGINPGEVLGGAVERAVMEGLTGGPVGAARGATTEAINGAVGGVVDHCMSCHGGGRNRNPN